MHSGLRSAATNGPTTPPRRPAVISAAAARCASVISAAGIGGILSVVGVTSPVWNNGVAPPIPVTRWVRPALPAFVQRLPRLRQRQFERFARQAGDERAHGPPEPERDVPRQRHRFTLDVDAAITLLEPPVAVETPQIPAALPLRLVSLRLGPGLRHFLKARAADPAARPPRRGRRKPRLVLAVHGHRNDLGHDEA